MQHEHDIAAMALWVGQHRGADAPRYIAEQIGRHASRGNDDCAQLWRTVSDHFERLAHTALSV